MNTTKITALAVLGLSIQPLVSAAERDELAEIREQMDALKKAYETQS